MSVTALLTIAPIFIVIGIGWIARKNGFIPPEFMGPANRLVFYIAIPAMIFRAASKGDFLVSFNPGVILLTLASVAVLFCLISIPARFLKIDLRLRNSFFQTAFHGNLGYIGLAVCFYALGDAGFAAASIMIGFVMIFQNMLAVFVLTLGDAATENRRNIRTILSKIIGNPVIFSALIGIFFSVLHIRVPEVAGKSLDILAGMGLPLALILIGASLTFDLVKSSFALILLSGFFKLILLPLIGVGLYHLWQIPQSAYAPGLILLASPSATITYIMAREMNGDPEFAVAAISASTLLSSVSFYVWLGFLQ